MTTYTVHLQGEDVQAASFVPEGFAWKAFLVPPLWLLWYRLWLAFCLWCFAFTLLLLVPSTPLVKELFLILIALLCGLEGQQWRRQKLMRQGKDLTDIVSGDSLEDAEIQFFHRHAERVPSAPVVTPVSQPAAAISDSASEPAFGLFPEPETRL
jgi:hypothetical protein